MMLTPWGPRAVPTGGAGVAAPAWSCTLTSAAIFFLGGIPLSLSSRGHVGEVISPATWFFQQLPVRRCFSSHRVSRHQASNLLDLGEAQLDRGLPAEDLDQGLDPLRLGVDLGDGRVQRGERAVEDHDRVR